LLDDAADTGVPDHISKWAGALSSVLAIIATLAGAAAAVSGGAERMFREQQLWTLGAIGALCLGIGLLAASLIFVPGSSTKSSARRIRLMGLSLPLFLTAVLAGAVAASTSASAQEEPSVTAKLTVGDSPSISGELTASGLTSADRFALLVQGFSLDDQRTTLFRTAQGPARDGSIAFPFEVPLRSHELDRVQVIAWRVGDSTPDCNQVETNELRRAACVLLRVPSARYGAPQLEVTRSDDGATLTGTLSAAVAPNRVMIVRVFANDAADAVYEAAFAANGNGVLEADLGTIRIPANGRACVMVAPADGDPEQVGCPPEADHRQDAAWTVISLPSTPP